MLNVKEAQRTISSLASHFRRISLFSIFVFGWKCASKKIAKIVKPRGSKLGGRGGHRRCPTSNKAAFAKALALESASANRIVTPLEYLFGTLRDQEVRVAEIAAPLVNEEPGRASRLATDHQATGQNKAAPTLAQARTLRDVEHRYLALLRKRYGPTENGGPLTESERREECELKAEHSKLAQQIECPPGYSPSEDGERLRQLHIKRLSPPSCGGGKLSGAEDDEEAILTARVAAYWQSPTGQDRKRLQELEFRRFSRRPLNDEEQKELDELRKKYPVVKTETEIGRKLRELQEQRNRDHGRTRYRPPD